MEKLKIHEKTKENIDTYPYVQHMKNEKWHRVPILGENISSFNKSEMSDPMLSSVFNIEELNTDKKVDRKCFF